MTKYQQARGNRRSYRNNVDKIRGGKLYPCMAEPVRPSEGGLLKQRVVMQTDPIPGRLITDIRAELVSVFVPVQAIDAIKDPAAAYAGLTDVIREKLLTGTPLFGLEDESEISKRCNVVPTPILGTKKVCEITRLAHNAAVNHLRIRKYIKSTLLLHTNSAVTPAILGSTALDRLNGVLDPEDRVNGAVELDINGAGIANVKSAGTSTIRVEDNTGTLKDINTAGATAVFGSAGSGGQLRIFGADLDLETSSVSLTDFYNAEKMDRLTREMRLMIDNNPEYGEEMVLNWAHGLSVDNGSVPWVLAERGAVFGKMPARANDTTGIEDDVVRTDGMVMLEFDVLVPKTELGGMVITFVTLKPDENLASQPHPILSQPWGLDNFVADELKIDPVPVTFREINCDVVVGDETDIAMYVGHNHLKLNYINYGFSRQADPATVENKAAVWQYAVPLSLSPESVLYPDYLDHGIFAFGGTEMDPAEVCTINVESWLNLATPMIVGPTPVEELAIIETGDVFEDA